MSFHMEEVRDTEESTIHTVLSEGVSPEKHPGLPKRVTVTETNER